MTHAMYSGNTDKDCYSDIAANTTGSYYDVMKESALRCSDKVLEPCQKEQGSVLTLADFGTGDGVNFLKLLKDIACSIHTNSRSTLQILVYLEDQPSIDFNLLYSKCASSKDDLLDENVFYATIGKSMYSQCLPSESVEIAFSSAALHWLSQIPCDIKDGLALVHANVYERKLFRQQAKKDWKQFLLSRGTELKKGGFMVMTFITSQDEDAERETAYMSEVWRKMFLQGKIRKEEYERTTLGFYFHRTEEDIRQPFNDPDIQSLGLRIVFFESRKHDFIPLQRIRKSSDIAVYVSALVDATRPFIRNVIYYGLDNDRSLDDKNEIIKHFFTALTDTVYINSGMIDFLKMKEVVVTKEK